MKKVNFDNMPELVPCDDSDNEDDYINKDVTKIIQKTKKTLTFADFLKSN